MRWSGKTVLELRGAEEGGEEAGHGPRWEMYRESATPDLPYPELISISLLTRLTNPDTTMGGKVPSITHIPVPANGPLTGFGDGNQITRQACRALAIKIVLFHNTMYF